jgi:hypothetical protein
MPASIPVKRATHVAGLARIDPLKRATHEAGLAPLLSMSNVQR